MVSSIDLKSEFTEPAHQLHLVKVIINFPAILQTVNDIGAFYHRDINENVMDHHLKLECDVPIIHVLSHYTLHVNPLRLKDFLRDHGFLINFNVMDFHNRKRLGSGIQEVTDVNGGTFIPRFMETIQGPPSHPRYTQDPCVTNHDVWRTCWHQSFHELEVYRQWLTNRERERQTRQDQ